MDENYVFPAIMKEEDAVVTIVFPTLDGAATCADREENVIEAAQELLALTLIDMKDRNQKIPDCDDSIVPGQDEKLVYIHVWLPYFRSKMKEVFVKKTLTIPVWLDILAKKNDINFSATLTEAIKQKLKLS